jgi:hypothetical protein
VPLAVDDQVWVSCHWDNTAGNQRIVDGEPEDPKAQIWAENGEMCVGYLTAEAYELGL